MVLASLISCRGMAATWVSWPHTRHVTTCPTRTPFTRSSTCGKIFDNFTKNIFHFVVCLSAVCVAALDPDKVGVLGGALAPAGVLQLLDGGVVVQTRGALSYNICTRELPKYL